MHGRISLYHCGKLGHVKRYCWKFRREKNEQKTTNNNNNTKEKFSIAAYGELLIIFSYEDACLNTCTHDSDWILDYGASYDATPRKEN